MNISNKPMTLIVLDGWGYREEIKDNAIAQAKIPFWDALWANYPHTLINASAHAVGLPSHQMGNSEVGHLNLGAGRIVFQEVSRIGLAIESGEFFNNPALCKAVDNAVTHGKAVHILGLLSQGGVHSLDEQIQAMVELAVKRGADKVFLHAFLDGRDAPPKSAAEYITSMEAKFKQLGGGRFATVIGRYFAMDRDNRWSRTQDAFELIANGKSEYQANSAMDALDAAYLRDETDEFVKTTAICPNNCAPVTIDDGDSVIFMNFRSDRARQLTRAFISDDFDGFSVNRRPKLGSFVTLTHYSDEFKVPSAFTAQKLDNVFGAYISSLGLKQLRIAETEKYAHVTFFLNGGIEEPFPGEDRILVPSPKVATYDLQPEMNAVQLTDKLVEAISSRKYDAIICNYANPDMVGHTGNLEATITAIETLNVCLERVVSALQKVGGEALITADHGNAEMMRNDETEQAHTAHTTNPVPFIYVGRKPAEMRPTGALSDVIPTMLYLMDIPKPKEMDGISLVTLK